MPTMREIADVIRRINTKLPPARIIVRKKVDNKGKIFDKLVAKKVPIYITSGDLEYPDLDDYDPWGDLDLGMPND